MSYATLMVVLELGATNEGLLKFTADLAERFTADVIGIATCRPIQIIYGDPYMSGDLIQRDLNTLAASRC